MKERFPNLLKPLTIGGITLKHRMMASPTSQAELGAEEHYSKENIEYYKLRALGGASLVTVGDLIVDLDTGRGHPQQVGINCGYMHKVGLMHEIDSSENIHPAMGMRCTRIEKDCVYAADKDGKEISFPCDTVVMASGMRSRNVEVEALRPLVKEFYVIGDARKAAKIMNANRDAYDAVTALGYM